MMINAIRNAFKARLPSLDWMDDKTRRAAIDKVMIHFVCKCGLKFIMLICQQNVQKFAFFLLPANQFWLVIYVTIST
jgi:hypothetical protein